MKIKKRKGMLHLELPVTDPPRKSKSGKTLLVASYGPRRTPLIVNGQHCVAIVNVYIRPEGYVKGVRIRKKLVGNRPADRKRRRVKRGIGVKRRSFS